MTDIVNIFSLDTFEQLCDGGLPKTSSVIEIAILAMVEVKSGSVSRGYKQQARRYAHGGGVSCRTLRGGNVLSRDM